MRSRFRFHSRYLLVLCAVTLSLLGLVFIYSASGYEAELTYGDAFFYVKKQAISFAAGIVCLIAARFLKPKILRKGRVVILLFSLVSLGLVFIPGLGVESYGATRWINLGFTTVQPSEIAKFGLMIYLASYLDGGGGGGGVFGRPPAHPDKKSYSAAVDRRVDLSFDHGGAQYERDGMRRSLRFFDVVRFGR